MKPQADVRLIIGLLATGSLAACNQDPAAIRADQLQQAIDLLRQGDAAACVHPLITDTALIVIGDNVGGSALIGVPTEEHVDIWRRMDPSIVTAGATLEAVNPDLSRIVCRASLEAYVGEHLRTAPLFYGAQPTADGSDIVVDIVSMTAPDELFAAAMMSEITSSFLEPIPPRDEESAAIQRGIAANNAYLAEQADQVAVPDSPPNDAEVAEPNETGSEMAR